MITYRDGKSNVKADALIKQAGSVPTDPTDERLLYQNRALLNPEQFLDAVPTNPVKTRQEHVEINDITPDPNLPEETIYNQIRHCVAQEEEAQRVAEAIRRKDKKVRTSRGKLRLDNTRVENGLIWFQNRIWVPESCVIKVIQEVYSQLAAGHPRQRKTILLASQTFTWKGMTGDINRFINNCYTCRRGKAPRKKKHGLLEPLPILE